MILLITGASHTGKTLLAQRLMETCKYPYLSINKKISLSMRALLEQPAVEEVVEEAAEDNAPVIYSTDNPDSHKSFGGDEE